jgi:hypothetical protein
MAGGDLLTNLPQELAESCVLHRYALGWGSILGFTRSLWEPSLVLWVMDRSQLWCDCSGGRWSLLRFL